MYPCVVCQKIVYRNIKFKTGTWLNDMKITFKHLFYNFTTAPGLFSWLN